MLQNNGKDERKNYKRFNRALKREAKRLGIPYGELKDEMNGGSLGFLVFMSTGEKKKYYRFKEN